MLKICFTRAGFQMLTSALDPSFTLSSDWYYRSLLAKVFDCIILPCFIISSQIYAKGKVTIKQFIEKDEPEFVSLALDGWSIHHHGYMGAIASKC